MRDQSHSVAIEAFTYDIDFAGHVSNISYIRWLEVARVRLLEAAGLPLATMVAHGFAPFLTRTDIKYRRPVALGQLVEVRYGVGELRSLSARVDFRLVCEDQLVAEASQWNILVNLATGRPHRLSREHAKLFDTLRWDGVGGEE